MNLIFILNALLIIFIYYTFVTYFDISLHDNLEGFESQTFCLLQGYPKSFCDRVPIQSYIQYNTLQTPINHVHTNDYLAF